MILAFGFCKIRVFQTWNITFLVPLKSRLQLIKNPVKILKSKLPLKFAVMMSMLFF